MAADNLQPILRHIEGANRQDAEAFAAPFSINSTNHGRPAGREGVRRIGESIFMAFPDCHFDIQVSIVSGSIVMCEMTMSGTHRGMPMIPVLGGELVGVPATGRRINVHHMHLFRIEAAEIVEHRAVRDDLGMMQQLGLVRKSTGSAADLSRIGRP
jgi:predicted ester cyclase